MSGRRKCDSSSSSSCDVSSSTMDVINKMCNDCDRSTDFSNESSECDPRDNQPECKVYERNHRPTKRYDPGIYCFNSLITPMSELNPQTVEFRMRRKNKTVTLQWEPFSGTLAANGIAYLSVRQSICNLPPYPICVPIYIKYKDVGRITFIKIDPYDKSANIKFYLNTDGSSANTNDNDVINIIGGAITWITD